MKELRFPKHIMFGIEKLAKTKAEQIMRSKARALPMSKDQKVDPYEDDEQDRKRAEITEYLLDTCDEDNEKY